MNRAADILVVDDEPVVLEAAAKVLPAGGLTVETVSDAHAALGRLERNSYGAVLSDLVLPGMDGFALLPEIQRLHPRTPVVIITGYATVGKALESFKCGAFDFLPKPFDFGELLATSRRALGFSRLEASAQRNVTLAEFAGSERRAADARLDLRALGQHSWVSLHEDGTARVGIGESFRGVARDLIRIELPGPREELLQGNECARLLAEDDLVHRLWSPIGGTVIAINPDWATRVPEPGPGADRWLLNIAPNDAVTEAQSLTSR